MIIRQIVNCYKDRLNMVKASGFCSHIHLAADYRIGWTRVICNPVGYPEVKKTGYTENLMIEI